MLKVKKCEKIAKNVENVSSNLEGKDIKKSIMSPMISSKKSTEDNINLLNEKISIEKNKLIKLRKFVEKSVHVRTIMTLFFI